MGAMAVKGEIEVRKAGGATPFFLVGA